MKRPTSLFARRTAQTLHPFSPLAQPLTPIARLLGQRMQRIEPMKHPLARRMHPPVPIKRSLGSMSRRSDKRQSWSDRVRARWADAALEAPPAPYSTHNLSILLPFLVQFHDTFNEPFEFLLQPGTQRRIRSNIRLPQCMAPPHGCAAHLH